MKRSRSLLVNNRKLLCKESQRRFLTLDLPELLQILSKCICNDQLLFQKRLGPKPCRVKAAEV